MRTTFRFHAEYIEEKLCGAVTSLAASTGNLTERLALALDSELRGLETSDLGDLQVPAELGEEIQDLLRRLKQSYCRPTETSRDLRLDEIEAEKLVSDLVYLYGRICRLRPGEADDKADDQPQGQYELN